MAYGTLFLIPVPLAEDAAQNSFTPFLSQTINHISEYIAENEKTARRFLKQAGITIPQSQLTMHDYGKHSRNEDQARFINSLLEGKDVGLMSEAGCPGVADPGAEIVALAHQKNIRVVPLVGPSSVILALMASGLNGQNFAFNGYLPIDKTQRSQKIKELEQLAERNGQTQLFIETPYRNRQLLDDLLKSCKPQTRLCIACNLTAANEFVKTKSIAAWRKEPPPDLHKQQVIFLLYRSG